ncbi:hypothetical protein BDA96_02G303900, partial [Sorghum bicolor]
ILGISGFPSFKNSFIELEELFLLDEMIKEKPKTHVQKLPIGIHKEIIQLAKIDNEDHLHIILHFSTNIICLASPMTTRLHRKACGL